MNTKQDDTTRFINRIMELCSEECDDFGNLRMIYENAYALSLIQRQRAEEAAFLETCQPYTHDRLDEVMEYPV